MRKTRKKVIASVALAAAAITAGTLLYNRSDWPLWIDADGDCQSTREEVLIEESLEPVTMDEKGCKVLRGTWWDPYTARVFEDPKQLDVDHVVPLSEAWKSGGNLWNLERRREYANFLDDPVHLMAVQAAANRQKGDKDPARWMPPNESYHCEYVSNWIKIKTRWNLSVDDAELTAINQVLESCEAIENDRAR